MERKSSKASLILLVILIILLMGSCVSCKPKNKADKAVPTPTSAANYLKFDVDDYRSTYDAIARDLISQYVSCTLPDSQDFSDWVYSDWNDEDNGMVSVTTSATVEGSTDKQSVFLVFTTDKTGKKYSANYLCVGDTLYYDDGKCDDALSQIGMPTNNADNTVDAGNPDVVTNNDAASTEAPADVANPEENTDNAQ